MEALASFLPLIIIFAVFWFLFIRPQKKKQKEYQEMISNLTVGDRIVTIGRIKGRIIKIKSDELKIKIAPNVEIKTTKNAVARVIESKKKAEDIKEKEE